MTEEVNIKVSNGRVGGGNRKEKNEGRRMIREVLVGAKSRDEGIGKNEREGRRKV